jgi:alpha-mannosidase
MDKYERRRVNLAKLITDRCDGVVATFAKRIGRDASYVTRMLYPDDKPGRKRMGDNLKETIELEYSLERGALDADPDETTPRHTKYPTPVYQLSHVEKAAYIIDGIHALMHLADIPSSCLGHTPSLKAAIMSGKPPTTYDEDIIRLAVMELWAENNEIIQHLTGIQAAELLAQKLRGWIDTPQKKPTPTAPGSSTK